MTKEPDQIDILAFETSTPDVDDTPATLARREAKRAAEFERGLRLGWWDADGKSLLPDDDDE